MNCEKEYRQFMFDYDFHIFIVAWHGEAIPNSISRGVVFLFVRERILFDIALGSIQFFFFNHPKENEQKAKRTKNLNTLSQFASSKRWKRWWCLEWVLFSFFSSFVHSSVFLFLYFAWRHRPDIYLQTQSRHIIIL